MSVAVLSLLLLAGCRELERPKVEPFYAVTVPPPKQELRWSNGKMPKSLDPARAAAAPETDIIRATYEGLTDLDSKSLREIPAIAEKWESTADLRTWTFHIRKDARWSNGERVSARDFVRSWKRLVDLREKAANVFLFQNIVGMKAKDIDMQKLPGEPLDFLHPPPSETVPQTDVPHLGSGNLSGSQLAAPPIIEPKKQEELPTGTRKEDASPTKFGVEAVDDATLKVNLELPDKDFPKLVSNPIFRPVYGDGLNFEQPGLDPLTVTNGAFQITKNADDGISLERSETYWNKNSIALERIRFVASNSAETALEAYKKGEVDVVTNAVFEPLALKLLSPYEDFRRTSHNALNFYEFNTSKAPFNDRRIREALAIAIDRDKLTHSDLEGTTQPATTFFPLGEQNAAPLSLNAAKAQQLLENAGYLDGTGFPLVRLVVNRNDIQQRVARSVARMWKQNLNLDTVILVKEATEIEDVRKSGDFDLLRRGVVLPVNDELVNITAILGSAKKIVEKPVTERTTRDGSNFEKQAPIPGGEDSKGGPVEAPGEEIIRVEISEMVSILTEEDAIFELKVIPLYFPTTYSLVKPYIRGFEMNGLDAPSLKEVSIDNNWQPKSARSES
ncbi:MAG: peptide ABC transporter substrate-binding protein [Pyrinomonadaceae bacterium]